MKKYFLLLLLFTQQQKCVITNPQDAYGKIGTLTTFMQKQLTQGKTFGAKSFFDFQLVNSLETTIADVTQYANNNNKNLIGKKDMTLEQATKDIATIFKNIVARYKNITMITLHNPQLRAQEIEYFKKGISITISTMYKKLSSSYYTTAQKNAQTVLFYSLELLSSFINFITTKLENIAIDVPLHG